MQFEKTVCTSVQQTLRLAEELAKNLQGGDVVLLTGELGAGKTHFVKGMARALGVEDVVTSPTFALHNSYQGSTFTLNHFDFYRIQAEEAEILGLNEFFFDKSGVCAVEWWQNVKPLLPKRCIEVLLEKQGDSRVVTIKERLSTDKV